MKKIVLILLAVLSFGLRASAETNWGKTTCTGAELQYSTLPTSEVTADNFTLTYYGEVSSDNPEDSTEILLTASMFHEWSGSGADATITGSYPSIYCEYQINESAASASTVYGNSNVSATAYADLTAYEKLVLEFTEGTPRVIFNRSTDTSTDYIDIKSAENQYVNVDEDGSWTINLAAITETSGYAHLNAIKGANWTTVVITNAELFKKNVSPTPSAATNLSIDSFAAEPGETFDLNILMNNPDELICGAQFDIVLPEGFSFVVNENQEPMVTYGRSTQISTEAAVLQDGSLRVLAYSSKNYLYEGTEGAIATIKVSVNTNIAPGTKYFQIKNITLSKKDNNTISKLIQEDLTYNYKLIIIDKTPIIQFVDSRVKELCVNNWDLNEDGEFSEYEASQVTDIGDVFFRTTELTSFNELKYFTGLKSIPTDGFYDNYALTEIIIPDNVETIGWRSFAFSFAMVNMTLGTSVKTIEGRAFDGSAMTKITSKAVVPPTLAEDFTNVKYVFVPKGCGAAYRAAEYWKNHTIIEGDGDSIYVTVDEAGTLGEQIVMQVDGYDKVNHLFVTGNLNSDDTQLLRDGDFCVLMTLDLSATNLKEVPEQMCYQRTMLKKVVLPESVKTIGNNAFTECKSLTQINFPSSLETIGQNAFYYCTSLAAAELPASLKTINGGAFAYCTNMKTIHLNEGLETLQNSSFEFCSNIKEVTIPNSLTQWGSSIFNGCGSLDSVVLPTGMTTIPAHAFRGTALRTVVIPEGYEKLDESSFYYCKSLESVLLPSTMKTISSYAFGDCSILSAVELPEGLEVIEYGAFMSSGIKSITLPSTLKKCGAYILQNCTNLDNVQVNLVVPPTVYDNEIASDNEYENAALYVPEISLFSYKSHAAWSKFNNIRASLTEPMNIIIDNKFHFSADQRPTNRPNMAITTNTENNTYGYVTVRGDETLSLGTFEMNYVPKRDYDVNAWDFGYNDVRSNTVYPTLITYSPVRSDSVVANVELKTMNWNFISLPFDIKVSDIKAVYDNTFWTIRRYAGEKRAAGDFDNTWQDVTSFDILNAGEGFIVMANRYEFNQWNYWESKEDAPLMFPAQNNSKKNNIFSNADQTVALNAYASEYTHNRGWNLIGNPYPSYYDTRKMDFTAPITVWNPVQNNYKTFSPVDDSYILLPGEAFFVQCPVGEERILFPATGRQNTVVAEESSDVKSKGYRQSAREVFNLRLSNDNCSDRTRFVINPDIKLEYDPAVDASKFDALSDDAIQLYVISGGISYAIDERPDDDQAVVLGYQTGKKGIYSLSLQTQSGRQVILYDSKEQCSFNLCEGDYLFLTDAGKFTDRFTLTLSKATDIQMMSVPASDSPYSVNMAGQQVGKDYRGVIIKNGEKVLNK